MIAEGKKAPDFTLPDSTGKEVSLSDYAGKKVLLVFYPGDDTPVCTTQLCSYRDNFSAFTERGITVLGISTNTIESHESFASRNELPFTLLSDSKKKVSEDYGALNFLGMSERAYVYIDEAGTVRLSFSELLPLFYRSTQDLLAQIDSFSNNA
ncbi:alkyl hydroperoxide reductase/ Thiol specific antioxidant/ Mal allergen [Chloroherpeton thalassium ATCC 35110]|uniref:thioredoxin-dependent peroxiredoxin n=1 Tax=Chloroherpeton thalassium (strain ATCC 35110 / GB-78) TaxID=517418 RepID=B3QVN7_CHLT3|nr:peroxiredoxin [Chloroherpeton thalassium]ACF13094.1 alkyl hydroperoxide reductase/ Thiol specific antioxidant/ Mal allergen [Chloroherpeton thalassium ATCC 35110]